MPQTITLVKPQWTTTLNALLSLVRRDLAVSSPFVKLPVVRHILSELQKRALLANVRVAVLTDLKPENFLAGASDLEAFVELGRTIPKFQLTHLPSLHAKVYLADLEMAVVTSANLTTPGLSGNVEYGIAITRTDLVREIRSDFENYSFLGAVVPLSDLEALHTDVEELKGLYAQAQRALRTRARRVFHEKLQLTQYRLLRRRAAGKTTHSIFFETIKFLLAKGPLRTEELHPLVQMIHPDLCDDSIDRVIDDVNFGKRWKHYVRNAQQYLKRRGEVAYERGRWRLVRKS